MIGCERGFRGLKRGFFARTGAFFGNAEYTAIQEKILKHI